MPSRAARLVRGQAAAHAQRCSPRTTQHAAYRCPSLATPVLLQGPVVPAEGEPRRACAGHVHSRGSARTDRGLAARRRAAWAPACWRSCGRCTRKQCPCAAGAAHTAGFTTRIATPLHPPPRLSGPPATGRTPRSRRAAATPGASTTCRCCARTQSRWAGPESAAAAHACARRKAHCVACQGGWSENHSLAPSRRAPKFCSPLHHAAPRTGTGCLRMPQR